MKNTIIILVIIIGIVFLGSVEVSAQWSISGSNIYNTNSGNVGIGTNSPASLLHVVKNMTEPSITVQNLGGSGGATYTMTDNASGANWKFKATNSGGFKIRDNAFGLDVLVIEPNSFNNALYIANDGNIGIGTSSPAASALVDMTSTAKGFLMPRMTQAQIAAIPDPMNGFTVYCTTDHKLYTYIESITQWKEISYGAGTISPQSCGGSFTKYHEAGVVAPVTKTVTYGTVNNIPGENSKCWITSNLGSDHQATAVNDATEASAGWYWQYNRKQGFMHDGATRTPNTAWISPINDNVDWQAANDPCTLLLGASWRIPTKTEWENVDAAGSWTDWNGPWNSLLKLHAAGQIFGGNLTGRGLDGFYWTKTLRNTDDGFNLFLNSSASNMSYSLQAGGFTLRCIKEL